MSKFTSRADLLIAAGNSIKLQESAGIEPVFKLHDGPDGNDVRIIQSWRPVYDSNPNDYEFPLAVIEGKPVFVGDELYGKTTGTKFVMKEGNNPQHHTWNPPKPATVMVEMNRDTAEAYVAHIGYIAKIAKAESVSADVATSIQKALEK